MWKEVTALSHEEKATTRATVRSIEEAIEDFALLADWTPQSKDA
jgi:hypothetical protein